MYIINTFIPIAFPGPIATSIARFFRSEASAVEMVVSALPPFAARKSEAVNEGLADIVAEANPGGFGRLPWRGGGIVVVIRRIDSVAAVFGCTGALILYFGP